MFKGLIIVNFCACSEQNSFGISEITIKILNRIYALCYLNSFYICSYKLRVRILIKMSNLNNNSAMQIEPSFEKRESLGDRPKKMNEPSQSELCETVLLLKQIMPHRSLQRVIIMLYESLVKKKTPQEIYNQFLQALPDKPINSQQQPNPTKNEVTRVYQKDGLQKTNFNSKVEESQYKEKRLVAKSFVGKGYGHLFAIDEFSKAKFQPIDKESSSFNQKIYRQTISAVLTQAWRKLESFLMQDCKKKITPLNKEQMKKLMTPLVSSSAFGQNLPIFKKYVRLLFGLSNVTLTEGQSIKFYLQALKHLNGGKIITLEQIEANANNSQEKPQNSQTNSQNQQCLKQLPVKIQQSENNNTDQITIAKLYIQFKSLKKCSKHFNNQYSSVAKLRSKLLNILRISLKQVEKQDEPNHKIYSYNQKDIESMFNNKKGLKIRLLLCEYFINSQNRSEETIIESINQFLSNKGQNESIQSSLQEQPSCELLYHRNNQKKDEVKQEQQQQ